MRSLIKKLTHKGEKRIECVKNCLKFTGEDSAMTNQMLSMIRAFAEFERFLIYERHRENISYFLMYSYVIRSQAGSFAFVCYNVEQRASYGQFSGETNDTQFGSFFLLEAVDMDFIKNRRGRANRLAVAYFFILMEYFYEA